MSDAPRPEALDETVESLSASETGGRKPTNPIVAQILIWGAFTWSAFQLWFASPLPFTFNILQFNNAEARAIHLGFAVFLGFLAFPAISGQPGRRGVPPSVWLFSLLPSVLFLLVIFGGETPLAELGPHLAVVVGAMVIFAIASLTSAQTHVPVIDWLLAAVAAFCASYGYWFYEALSNRPGNPIPADILVALAGLLLLLQVARRSLGPPLMTVASVLLLYVFFGNSEWVPDDIRYAGASLGRAMTHMWLGPEGVFGIALGVSTKVVFLFVLFGALLEKAGAGNYFIKVAFSLLGHLRGGPAKAAVVASGMTGLISGSSIANVVTTGTFTMPLMKRVGFSSEKAGAVEVASSVNGQIMPPVMGAAAFLMVEYVGISYVEVIKHAFLPAIISYIALVYIVHLEALKTGMQGLPKPGQSPAFRWRMIALGFTLASILIIAGAAYWIAAAAALFDNSALILLVVLVVAAAQIGVFSAISRARSDKPSLISVGLLVAFNVVLGIFGLYHLVAIVGAALGPASAWVAVVAVLAGVAGLIWYAAKFPELELDDPNAKILSLPEVGPTVKAGLHYLLPILVLVWCLIFLRLSPSLSVFYATVLMMAIAVIQRPLFALFRGTGQSLARAVRAGIDDLFEGMVAGARNMIGMAIAMATAGVIVGIVSLTGIGFVLADFVEEVSGGILIVMLVMVAIMSLILGMGLPTTANYILVANIMAPVIVQVGASNGLAVPLIAVHLFVFYFGIMADVTPPVGLASFAAAAVSGGDPMKTGFTAFYYSLRTALLPFLFIFNTDLILYNLDSPLRILLVVISSTVAMLIFAAATQGYFFARCRIWEIAALILVAFSIFRPNFWMDQMVPPTLSVPGAEVMERAAAVEPGGNLQVVLEGRDLNTDAVVQRGFLLPMGAAGSAEERLAAAGIEVREAEGEILVDFVAFGSAAEELGVEWDFRFAEVLVDNDAPPPELIWIPALGLLALVIFFQRRRIAVPA